jgi:hypothetical protein
MRKSGSAIVIAGPFRFGVDNTMDFISFDRFYQLKLRYKSMIKTSRNIAAIILGIALGSIFNGLLISISGKIIPPPEGVDLYTMEGLKSGIHLFEPKHFLFPFLAHALGTFVGAIVAVLFAVSHKFKYALTIGILFLLAGIINAAMLPAPIWFNIVDLFGAYIPMALLAYKLTSLRSTKTSQ